MSTRGPWLGCKTPEEWQDSSDPTAMLYCLWGKSNSRQLRLFAVACCQRNASLITDDLALEALTVAKAYAEGRTNEAGLAAAEAAAAAWLTAAFHASPYDPVSHHAEAMVRQTMVPQMTIHNADDVATDAAIAVAFATRDQNGGDAARMRECQAQSTFLRDIFGNPFRPVEVAEAWLRWNDGAAPKIARTIYDERAFDRLPLLADALEEAGCDDLDVLTHCRGATHTFAVVGSWISCRVKRRPPDWHSPALPIVQWPPQGLTEPVPRTPRHHPCAAPAAAAH
jgi:hypothetical protein